MSEAIQAGALYVVSTPIGNLDDITLRAVKVLGGVDVIAAEDTRKTGLLLKHLSLSKPLVSFHSYNEAQRVPGLLRTLKDGRAVALVTDAGTPGISDPAYALIAAAVDEGVTVLPVPGASAVLAALVASGLPMDRFAFEGFLPAKKGRRTKLEQLRNEERTIVIYEAPHRVERTLADILDRIGDRHLALARELTKKFEEVRRGRVSDVLTQVRKSPPKGECVLVVAGARFTARRADASSPNPPMEPERP